MSLAISLEEGARDSLKVFEEQTSLKQYRAAKTILSELLFEIRLQDMFHELNQNRDPSS